MINTGSAPVHTWRWLSVVNEIRRQYEHTLLRYQFLNVAERLEIRYAGAQQEVVLDLMNRNAELIQLQFFQNPLAKILTTV